eukprot:767292-Hanusia_phi.AAC.2
MRKKQPLQKLRSCSLIRTSPFSHGFTLRRGGRGKEGGEIGGVKVGLSENEEEKLIQKKSADHDTVHGVCKATSKLHIALHSSPTYLQKNVKSPDFLSQGTCSDVHSHLKGKGKGRAEGRESHGILHNTGAFAIPSWH